jgi:hypothetical protein
MPTAVAISMAIIVAAALAWDIARRYVQGADRDALQLLRADLEQHKADTDKRLTDAENKIKQVGNRPPQGARRLTGLGGR